MASVNSLCAGSLKIQNVKGRGGGGGGGNWGQTFQHLKPPNREVSKV